MDSSKIKALIIGVLAAFFALYLGVIAATARMEAILWVAGALFLTLLLSLGRHVWILIPLSLGFSGNINAIPGSPAVWWLAMASAGGMFVFRFLMRHHETFQFRFSWLDFAILIQVLAVWQSYLRNPTGFSIFGGDTVGGKPYVIFAFAIAAYAVQSVVKTDIKMVRRVVIGVILVSVADGLLIVTSQLVPAVAMLVLPIYSGADFAAARSGVGVEAGEGRLTAGKDVGQSLGLAACSLYQPLSTLNPLRFGRFLMMMFSIAIILLSGFRSVLAWIIIAFVVGSLIRRRYMDVVISGIIGLFGISLIAVTGTGTQLPFSVQRGLSAIPFIEVDPSIRHGAENSTDWRVEMWKLALFSDKYIQNKWLGDGFGYSAAELQASQDSAFGDQRRSRGMSLQDVMLARGSYHGFHVETIRFTGALGLVFALISMGIFFRSALRLIGHFKGRPEWGYVIFICMPFLIAPFYNMLVFGSYRVGFPELLAAAGFLKVLDNIRVRELATAHIEAITPELVQAPIRSLPPGRTPQLAIKR
jgi:hypothetical protein